MTNNHWHFTRDDVEMVLNNYYDLATGAQLNNSTTTNNPESQRGYTSCHATYEESCMLAAEVCRRVRKCGLDGLLVEERYGLKGKTTPKTIEQIADERDLKDDDILRRINKVIWYCCGKKPKELDYEHWKRLKHYRKKDSTMVVI